MTASLSQDQIIIRKINHFFGPEYLYTSPIHLESTNFVIQTQRWLNNQLNGAIFLFQGYDAIKQTDHLAEIYQDPRLSLLNHTTCILSAKCHSKMVTILPRLKQKVENSDTMYDIELKTDVSSLIVFDEIGCYGACLNLDYEYS